MLTLLEQESQTKEKPKYCPHKPFPKQQAFLDLDCTEAFYGGGAGPGKTDALLMAALQYVHVPNYSALILRRDFARLALPGAIMDRSKEWLMNTDAKWNEQRKTWTFPSNATIQFGYIDNPDDRFRYASAEFQFIGWDELTEFRLTDDESNPYLFMFSRMRKAIDMDVPIRMRSASNPGGTSHVWVKKRFITQEAIDGAKMGKTDTVYWGDKKNQDLAFVPALLRDNPAIDADKYMERLSHLPPVTRQRLVNGDWSVVEDSIINGAWFRRYTMRGLILEPRKADGSMFGEGIDERECRRFAVLDSAGTEEDKEKEKQGKPPSYSALGVWDYAANYDEALFLRHVWRGRVGFTDLIGNICRVLDEWDTTDIYIENAHYGKAIADVIRQRRKSRVKVHFVQPTMGLGRTGKPGKVERSTKLQNKMEKGQYYLPDTNVDWLLPYEGELLSWTGKKDDIADQVDISSYAAMICDKGSRMRSVGEPWRGANGFSLLG